MASTIDSVTVTMNVVTEFEGQSEITFTFIPTDQLDPLLVALLNKNHELLMAAAERDTGQPMET